MKFAVLKFPGSNCDRDMYNAAIKSGVQAEYVDYRNTSLDGFDGVLIPGGFFFFFYLRSGAMASFAPITEEVKRLASEGNDSHLFVSRNESLKVVNNQTAFTNLYDENEVVVYPVAHGEGHYYCTPDTYEALDQNNQIILKYVDNPNGSFNDIAGIVNEQGNVCGMMPHPERAIESILGTDSGVKLFEAMVNSWREQNV